MDTRNIRIVLAYEGTNYHGWQKQPGLTTIQGNLENGLKRVTGEAAVVVGAGRTDAGVHARGQVANFHIRSPIPIERFPTVLNSVLSPDIIVREAVEVDPGFHSQYWAKAKTYLYRIDNGRWPDLFWRRFAYHRYGDFHLDAMAEAASLFTGEHDFRAFCAANTPVKTFNRRVESCTVSQDGHLIIVSITANGFLYNMVRIIAGTLLEVARGRMAPGHVATILASGRRELAGPTLPPHGLCLEEVQYVGEPPTGT